MNDAPSCADLALATEEDAAAAVPPSCSDVDGDALTHGIAAQGTKGTASVVDGELRYQPNANAHGSDGFTYVASDGTHTASPAIVAVTIAPVDDPPATRDDTLTSDEDATGTVAVLANDSDPDGDVLTLTDATDGAHGAVECTSAGSCTYTPRADSSGPDSFTYTVSDGRGGTATGTVAVTVTSVNDPPVVSEDTAIVGRGGTLVLDVAADDSPGPADEQGQTLTVRAIERPPSYGAAKVLADGTVRYRPPERYTGPDWLDYEVCDDGTTAGAPDPRCAVGSVRLKVQRVAATVETDPVPDAGDAADDAAIWVNSTDPAKSTIIGTDKGGVSGVGGLAVYDLAGTELQHLAVGKMNNVDLRPGFPLGGENVDLVAASRRTGGHWGIVLLRVDRTTGTLVDLASPVPLRFEPYGLCLYRSAVTGKVYAFVTENGETGHLEQWELRGASGTIEASLVRSFDVGSLSEGCVADDEHGALYVAEEHGGIWRYAAEPEGGSDRVLVDPVGPEGNLAADVEGLALAKRDDGSGYLVASSQGDRRYVVYRRGATNRFVRSFTIDDANGIDGTSGIDGIDVTTASLGPSFPGGALVSQDGTNTSSTGEAQNQNFKVVPLELALGDGSRVDVPDRPTSCDRPYAETSPWNAPIGSAPTHDPESDLHVTAFGTSMLSSDSTQFTYPVYEVTAETPLHSVTLSENGWYSNVTSESTITSEQGGTVQLPIPEGAVPAEGADRQIVLVNPETGDEWGASYLERDATTGAWTAWNVYHYNTTWSGVPPYGERSSDRFYSRGAGVPYLAGLVRPCELARGRIEHALAFAYDFPTAEFVYPATKSDGNAWDGEEDELDSHEWDVPEGTRLQLDPALTADEILGWGCTGPCLTIARALQEYGMYVIDNARRPKVMLEYEGTAGWNGAVDEHTVRPIPFSAFRVLAPPAGPAGP